MRDISSNINDRLPFKGKFALVDITDLSSETLGNLNEDERRELASFTNLRRQREYVTSRLALKKMSRKLGIPEFKILKDELGQPYGVANPERYYVSIAHTDKQVFCGISQHEAIGIDLEPVTRKVPQKLRQRISHPDEGNLASEIASIRLWTIKEAYIKLRGQGLRLNMNQVCLQRAEDVYFVELNNDKRAKICSFQLENSWLAIAYFQ